MILFNILNWITKPRKLYERNGLSYVKINKTSCDHEQCATVYHYWLVGQKESGRWIKVREVEFTEELKEMKE